MHFMAFLYHYNTLLASPMILEEGFLDPLEPPGSAPGTVHGFDKNIGEVFSSFNALPGYIHADALASKFT